MLSCKLAFAPQVLVASVLAITFSMWRERRRPITQAIKAMPLAKTSSLVCATDGPGCKSCVSCDSTASLAMCDGISFLPAAAAACSSPAAPFSWGSDGSSKQVACERVGDSTEGSASGLSASDANTGMAGSVPDSAVMAGCDDNVPAVVGNSSGSLCATDIMPMHVSCEQLLACLRIYMERVDMRKRMGRSVLKTHQMDVGRSMDLPGSSCARSAAGFLQRQTLRLRIPDAMPGQLPGSWQHIVQEQMHGT